MDISRYSHAHIRTHSHPPLVFVLLITLSCTHTSHTQTHTVVANTKDGYHGYWAQNIYEINPHFGTSLSLSALISACHSNGISVMVDVVANHVGPVGFDFSTIVPFSHASDYHSCTPCPSGCSIVDFSNQTQVQYCRLADLPVSVERMNSDFHVYNMYIYSRSSLSLSLSLTLSLILVQKDLNQDNTIVNDTLHDWISALIANFSIDGLRIDTVPEVNKAFWETFQHTANVYAVGEVFNDDVNYVAPYQDVCVL